jgi:hypothetical protein
VDANTEVCSCPLCGGPLQDMALPEDQNCESCGRHFCNWCATEMEGQRYCGDCFKRLGGEEWRWRKADATVQGDSHA